MSRLPPETSAENIAKRAQYLALMREKCVFASSVVRQFPAVAFNVTEKLLASAADRGGVTLSHEETVMASFLATLSAMVLMEEEDAKTNALIRASEGGASNG